MVNKTQIIIAGMRAGIEEMNPAYILSDVTSIQEDQNKCYIVYISDPKSGKKIPCIWSPADEDKNDGEDLIKFIYNFSKNAVDSLSDLIEFETTGELKHLPENVTDVEMD